MFQSFIGGGDIWSTIMWLVLFVLFMAFGPKMMAAQYIMKLEKEVSELEAMASKSRKHVLNFISKNPSPKIKSSVEGFMEFFAVPPVSTDPYGVVKKLDHIIKQSDKRFDYFVNQLVPEFSKEQKRDLKCALGGAITTHEIAKIVRHMVEIIKKYKMFQMAMIVQMQIPLIKRMAESAEVATKAFADEMPIGDSIGPLVVANMMSGKNKVWEDEEFAFCETKINGKTIIFSKADGPGATVAKPGKFVKKMINKKKINRVITIDAGLRLEGEKSGIVIEGVGIAMNPAGTDRFEIEEVTVNKNIPLDAIVVKVSDKEALTPMTKEVVDSVSNAIRVTKETINREKGKETILVMGVGNTCGVGNNPKSAIEAEKRIRNNIRKLKKDKKDKKKIFK